MTTLAPGRLVDQFERGLDAPICLTWELTYACNLACVHCLSSSGRRDPDELSTAEAMAVIDELQRMQVFYVNIGGGEPTIRPDFWDLLDYSVDHHVGVKFSTNGVQDHARPGRAAGRHRLPRRPDLARRRHRRGQRRRAGPRHLRHRPPGHGEPGRGRDARTSRCRWSAPATTSPSSTRSRPSPTATAPSSGSPGCARRAGAPTRGTSSTRTADQQRQLYDWLVANGDQVLTGDSFFHLVGLRRGPARAQPVRRRAGRVPDRPGGRRLRLPVRHPRPVQGRQRARPPAASPRVWRESELFLELREPQSGGACTCCSAYDSCRGGCMAAKFFTGLPLDAPDPECVKGHGETALAALAADVGQAPPVGRPLQAGLGARHPRAPPRPARQGLRGRPPPRPRRVPAERTPDAPQPLVRDRRRGPAPGQAPPAQVRLQRPAGRVGEGPLLRRQRRRPSASWASPPTSPGCRPSGTRPPR